MKLLGVKVDIMLIPVQNFVLNAMKIVHYVEVPAPPIVLDVKIIII